KPSYDLVRNVMLIQILHISPLSEVDAPRVPEGPLHNCSDRLIYFAHMSSRHLLRPNFSLLSLNLSGFVNKKPLPHYAASKFFGIELVSPSTQTERVRLSAFSPYA